MVQLRGGSSRDTPLVKIVYGVGRRVTHPRAPLADLARSYMVQLRLGSSSKPSRSTPLFRVRTTFRRSGQMHYLVGVYGGLVGALR